MAQFDLAAAKLKRRRELGPTPLSAVMKQRPLAGDELLDGWNGNHYPVLGQTLAEKLLDMADMLGFERAHELLRTAVNAMHLHPAIVIEPWICERTVQAIRFVIARQSEIALLGALRATQIMELKAIAEANSVSPHVLGAWMSRAHDC